MKLGRVIGTMVATVRVEGTEGLKLLIVRPVTSRLRPAGIPFVATDASAQAGPGALVTYEESREAALLHDPWFIPVDHAIVGIVDQYTYGDVGKTDQAHPGESPDLTGESVGEPTVEEQGR